MTYGTYAIGTQPTGSASSSTTTATLTVPGIPTAVTAAAGINSATVTFQPPQSDGGSPITSYTIRASNGQTASGAASPITISMVAGVTVSFTVHATNNQGSSGESAPSNTITISNAPDATKPVMNGTLSVINVTATTAILAWEEATDDVGVTGYGYRLNNGAYTTVAGLTALVFNLLPDSVYTADVVAYDSSGNASDPLSISFTTKVMMPPLAVILSHPRMAYVGVNGFSDKRSTGLTGFNKLTAVQDPQATLDYVFDWSEYLDATSSTIVSSEYFFQNLNLLQSNFNDKQAAAWVSTGAVGKVGVLTNRIITNDGRVDERSIHIKFKDQ